MPPGLEAIPPQTLEGHNEALRLMLARVRAERDILADAFSRERMETDRLRKETTTLRAELARLQEPKA